MAMLVKSLLAFVVLIRIKINGELVELEFEDKFRDRSLTVCSLFRGPTQDNDIEIPVMKAPPNFRPCETNQTLPAALFYRLLETPSCGFNKLDDKFIGSVSIIATGKSKISLSNFSDIQVFNSPFFFVSRFIGEEINGFFRKSVNATVEFKKLKYPFDPSIIFVALMGVFTLLIGSFWNEIHFKKIVYDTRRQSLDNANDENPGLSNSDDKHSITHSLQTKWKKLTVSKWFTLALNLAILLLVILLAVLVNVSFEVLEIILSILFTLASIHSLNRIMFHVMDRINFATCKIPKNDIPLLKKRPEIRKIIVFLLSVTFCWIWFGFRSSSWAWVLQNILVIAFCLNILSLTMNKSFKFCVIISVVYMVYDIFMIFILPLITDEFKVNKSLCFGLQPSIYSVHERDENMNTIDFSRSHGDSDLLPFYFVCPNIMDPVKSCNYLFDYPYTILGIGEILIPGIFLNYALIYDLSKSRIFRPFFIVNLIVTLIAYVVACLFVSLISISQPVSMFTVPVLIAASVGFAIIKKEGNDYWNGISVEEYIYKNSRK